MKKLLFLICFVPFFSFAQNRIITTTGDTILAKHIEFARNGLLGDQRLIYTNIDTGRRLYVAPDRISQIDGVTSNYTKKAILKRNPSVLFNNEVISLPEVPNSNQHHLSYSAGDYLMKAGRNYNLAFFLGVAGATITFVGASNGNDGGITTIGVLTSLSGIIPYLIGNSDLIKAGYQLNKKGMALKPSENGVGLALEF